MPNLQELGAQQAREVLAVAVDKQVPLTVTVQVDDAWHSLRSRCLGDDGRHIFITPPAAGEGERGGG